MRNHLFLFLVALIFSTSLNLSRCSIGQHFESSREGEKLKSNDRRASGLVPYPRIGRNSESTSFSRFDRAAGLIHVPRVGRSDLPMSSINFNHYHDVEPDAEFQFPNLQDAELDIALDQDYEGYPGRSTNFKHEFQGDKILKDIAWLIPDRVHSKEYRPTQKIDESRSFYPNIRGLRNNQLLVNGYTPRLGRENDHDVTSFL